MNEALASQQLLRLFQLVSPALPVGAYAYSRGLEWAVQAGWVKNEEQTLEWLTGLLQQPLCYLDAPVFLRLFRAWQSGNKAEVREWNAFLSASRESAEFQAEDHQMGRALARLLVDLAILEAKVWQGSQHASFASMFALAASAWGLAEEESCLGFLWGWTESSVAAAIKLVPLGQTAGQRILSRCVEVIPGVLQKARLLPDDDIGYMTPGLAIAGALHETQHTRLFRS